MGKKIYEKPETTLHFIPPELNMSEIDIEKLLEIDVDIEGTKENDDKLQDVE